MRTEEGYINVLRLWKLHYFLQFSLTCAKRKGEKQMGVEGRKEECRQTPRYLLVYIQGFERRLLSSCCCGVRPASSKLCLVQIQQRNSLSAQLSKNSHFRKNVFMSHLPAFQKVMSSNFQCLTLLSCHMYLTEVLPNGIQKQLGSVTRCISPHIVVCSNWKELGQG